MKVTRACSYAIHALSQFATQKDRTKPMPSHAVAKAEGIPERFLLKVLKPLVGVGILKSIKGPNGGYSLAKPPEKITMLEITEAVDGPVRMDAGFEGGNSKVTKGIEIVWGNANEGLRKELNRRTLAQVCTGKA